MNPEDFISRFRNAFGDGDDVRLVRAPGRVNLIGEHTDYNDGYVLPIAIEPELIVAYRVRGDSYVRLVSESMGGPIVEFALDQSLAPSKDSWTNYVRGVACGLLEAGVRLRGMDALVCSTIPRGAGLSSSAALEVAFARAWLSAAHHEMSSDDVAKLCQRAEHRFAGVPCGIMDQMIVAGAQDHHAMLLDCRSLEKKFVSLDPESLAILIVDSRMERRLVSGEYARRRAECEHGVVYFQSRDSRIKALRDVSAQLLNDARRDLPDVVYRRCRHVVSENARTLEAAACLERSDFGKLGQIMIAGHQSLRDDFEVSVPQLDFLVESATSMEGVFGARMTGAGFGGCVVILVQPKMAGQVSGQLADAYAAEYQISPHVYHTTAAAGAAVLSPT